MAQKLKALVTKPDDDPEEPHGRIDSHKLSSDFQLSSGAHTFIFFKGHTNDCSNYGVYAVGEHVGAVNICEET